MNKDEFVINLLSIKICKIHIVKVITKVWLTGVGSNIVGPLQTILNKGIMSYADIINLYSVNRTIIS